MLELYNIKKNVWIDFFKNESHDQFQSWNQSCDPLDMNSKK